MPPPLRFDVLEEVSKRLPGFPIVLHGSSSVPQEEMCIRDRILAQKGRKNKAFLQNRLTLVEDQALLNLSLIHISAALPACCGVRTPT